MNKWLIMFTVACNPIPLITLHILQIKFLHRKMFVDWVRCGLMGRSVDLLGWFGGAMLGELGSGSVFGSGFCLRSGYANWDNSWV